MHSTSEMARITRNVDQKAPCCGRSAGSGSAPKRFVGVTSASGHVWMPTSASAPPHEAGSFQREITTGSPHGRVTGAG